MDYSREMNSLDTSKDSKHSFLLNIRAFNIFKTRASSHFSFWLTEASLKQMQLLQPQRSGILRGNYLATGHEYNTDAVSRRLTVKLAFSPLAVHSLPRPLIRHLSRLHHSHAAASPLSLREHVPLIRTPSATKQAKTWRMSRFDGAVSSVAFAVTRSSEQSKLYMSATSRASRSQPSALQTSICLPQAESEGITKTN